MHNVSLIGNPNVGKSTLFNSLTKSQEHTGNFHGVTVDSKSKIVKLENEEYKIFDLPGIYSLNTYTEEENITKQKIFETNSINLMLVDSNSIKKNLYLCLQLLELNISFKILINNFDYFIRNKNKLNIKNLSEILNCDIDIINAKKIKLNKNILKSNKNNKKTHKKLNYLNIFIQKIKNKYNLEEETIIKAINGEYKNLNKEQVNYIKQLLPDIVEARYNYIDNILEHCAEIDSNFVYGYSKKDKFLLNPIVMILGFFILFFISIFLIFFKIGPFFAEILSNLINFLIILPLNNVLILITDNVWVLEFFSSGVCSSFTTVISFLPQICLLFMFLTMLEDSGIISRLAFVLDDFLSKFGLNGKAVYIILLGLGCNTVSTMATKNLNGKNLKTKSAIINPYISCLARLPIYVIVASAFFSEFAFLIVVGLYLLGVIVALTISAILNKKILRTQGGELLLEFAPLRNIDVKHILQVCFVNAKDFVKRIFGVVLSVGIIIWILTHTKFNLSYTQNINNSILFSVANCLTFIFAPIGLNNSGTVCALIVGFMAKELIVSSMCITNSATTNAELISSLGLSTSAICFTPASAISFLIFSSLYCSCASNLAVLKKETDTFTMWFSIISQFTIAYMLSFVVYQTLTKGWWSMLLAIVIIALILFAVIFTTKKVKQHKCLTCGKCESLKY